MKNFLFSIVTFFKRCLPDKSDFFLFIGLGVLCWGVYQIHQPSAYIVGGILLMSLGYIQVLPVKTMKGE